MPRKVLVLGSSGMAGHLLALYLRENTGFEVVDLGPRREVFPESMSCDIGDLDALERLIREQRPDAIVNCIGVLVKASETRPREAIAINADLPHFLSGLCASLGCRFLHLSTDCVFSGSAGPYAEHAPYDGQDFYGRSKALGEFDDTSGLVIRTSIIGPEVRDSGTGLFGWFMRNPRGTEVTGYRKALWSGVTTLELAKFIRYELESEPGRTGLMHLSVPDGISKFDLLSIINARFTTAIRIRPADDPALDKRLVCTRTDIGYEPAGYGEQIDELAKWMINHRELYGTQLGGL